MLSNSRRGIFNVRVDFGACTARGQNRTGADKYARRTDSEEPEKERERKKKKKRRKKYKPPSPTHPRKKEKKKKPVASRCRTSATRLTVQHNSQSATNPSFFDSCKQKRFLFLSSQQIDLLLTLRSRQITAEHGRRCS